MLAIGADGVEMAVVANAKIKGAGIRAKGQGRSYFNSRPASDRAFVKGSCDTPQRRMRSTVCEEKDAALIHTAPNSAIGTGKRPARGLGSYNFYHRSMKLIRDVSIYITFPLTPARISWGEGETR